MNNDTAFKSNSAVASIKLGYRLFASHFKSLFKSSWLYAVLFGLVFAAVGTILSVSLPSIVSEAVAHPDAAQALGSRYVGLLALSVALFVVGGIVEVVFYSRAFSAIGEHIATGSIARPSRWISFNRHMAWRTLKGVLATLLVVVVPIAVPLLLVRLLTSLSATNYSLFAICYSLFTILVMGVPMLFVPVRYILTDNAAYWPTLWKSFKTAFAHYGFVFIVALFVGVVMSLATLILQLPAIVLSTANYQAYLGVYYGDPLAMPGYVVPLSVAVFFVSGVMQAYIRMSSLFPLYYMYGSIETQEQERKTVLNY